MACGVNFRYDLEEEVVSMIMMLVMAKLPVSRAQIVTLQILLTPHFSYNHINIPKRT